VHQKRQCLWPLFVSSRFRLPSICRHDLAFTVVMDREFPADRLKEAQASRRKCVLRRNLAK
jgi:hypothetical protein